MKSVVFLLALAGLNTSALAEKDVKQEVKVEKVEVKKADPHKNLHLYFLDRRPYIAPKNDNNNKTSS